MSKVLLIEKNGTLVNSTDQWFEAAPPKGGARHWRDGYSAKELANAWTEGDRAAVPVEITNLLETHDSTAGFAAQRAEPEAVTRLDAFRGEGRNHDLVVEGEAGGDRILLAVEGKALESFGSVLANEISPQLATASKKLDRLNLLSAALFGFEAVDLTTKDVESAAGKLRYQLLTASVGAVIEAQRRGCSRAVLIVHEFRPLVPDAHEAELLAQNASDLDRFVDRLGAEHVPGSVAGPFVLNPSPFVTGDVELLIGKATRTLSDVDTPVGTPISVPETAPDEPGPGAEPDAERDGAPGDSVIPPEDTNACVSCGAALGRWRKLRSRSCRNCEAASQRAQAQARETYAASVAELDLNDEHLAASLNELGVARSDGIVDPSALGHIHRSAIERLTTAALADGRLSEDEEVALAQVLTSFALTADAIPRRLHGALEIGRLREGRLPVVERSSLIADVSEDVHGEFLANLLIEETVRKSVGGGGFSVGVGSMRVYSGSSRRSIPAGTKMRVHDRGKAIVTSRRTVFIGDRDRVSILHSQLEQISVSRGQLHLAASNRRKVTVLGISGSNYVAELVAAAARS